MGKSKFNPKRDIPSLKGKVILVTGPTSGLGKSAVMEFARHEPAVIWFADYSMDAAEATVEEIRKMIPESQKTELKPLLLDLASFKSVKSAAETVRASATRLDILMLNAGIFLPDQHLTESGYELHFGINYVGHALLVKLLLPLLLKTADEQPNADVRVVMLSSIAANYHKDKAGIRFDKLKTGGTGSSLLKGMLSRYAQSKLAVALYVQQLARRYPQIKVVAVHPGAVFTNIANSWFSIYPRVAHFLVTYCSFLACTPEQGARNQVYVSVAEGIKSGEFYVPVGKPLKRKSALMRDGELGPRLWEWTENELAEWELPVTPLSTS